MSDETYQFLNEGEGVSEATDIARRYVEAKRRCNGGSIEHAVGQVAIESRLRRSTVKRFFHPSREPKSVSLGIWRRLMGGYIAFLRRQTQDIEREIERVQALSDAPDRATAHLLRQAQTLVENIKALCD